MKGSWSWWWSSWGHWKDALTAARSSCNELAKGEQHQAVVAAMKILEASHSNTESELARVDADQRKWYERVRELRGWYKEDTKNVRDMFCNLEESPGDHAEGDAFAALLNQIAERMRSRLAPKWSELTTESNRILPILNDLKSAPEGKVRRDASILLGKLEASLRGLVNLMNDELKGANDPEFRMMVETGKNEHTRIQKDSSKCDESEVTIPGNGGRVDCVKASSGVCTIVEIKPNNPAAIAKGRTQVSRYRAAMLSYFESIRAKGKEGINDGLKDKLGVFKQCIVNGELEITTDVRVYDLCPPEGMMFRDFVVAE